ncbi:major facilitator superfamily sugar:cation symporter [Neobacillus bataviensis LMG 21833]|uniref:Major facilitator superfamily sugar:cation symporter n=1 Tax=Neobacillus bataviensis LMG 21833 TaxID=1117379 RepID=K6D9W5_9BACI|nr:MFS transporter [Neobacillus bataviensis]EKN69327.1 major facilitator superfamily sugar:cation symporter [Neobacillus bataviensis LMG 21833]
MLTYLRNLHPLAINILVGTMFGRMATSMSIPFLAIYLTQVQHVSPAQTGLIIAVSSLVGICTSFAGGYLSDWFGRKIILFFSVFLWAAVFALFGFAQSVAGFFVANALNGFCKSLFEPASRALLADLTDPNNRLAIFNLRYTAINIGVIFGPMLGFYFGSSKTTFFFYIAAGVYIIYGLSLMLTFSKTGFKGKHVDKPSQKKATFSEAAMAVREDKVLLMSLLGIILATTGYAQFNSTLPQFLSGAFGQDKGAGMFSGFLILNAVTVISLQYPLLSIGKKYSPIFSIMAGNLLCALGVFAFSLAESIPSWGAVVFLFTIGEVLMFSMTDAFIDSIAKADLRGTYFGAMGFTQIGSIVGPSLGGFLLDHFGYQDAFSVFGLLAGLSLFGVPVLYAVKLAMVKKSGQRSKKAG